MAWAFAMCNMDASAHFDSLSQKPSQVPLGVCNINSLVPCLRSFAETVARVVYLSLRSVVPQYLRRLFCFEVLSHGASSWKEDAVFTDQVQCISATQHRDAGSPSHNLQGLKASTDSFIH